MQFSPGRMIVGALFLCAVFGLVQATAVAGQEPEETKTVFLDIEGMT